MKRLLAMVLLAGCASQPQPGQPAWDPTVERDKCPRGYVYWCDNFGPHKECFCLDQEQARSAMGQIFQY